MKYVKIRFGNGWEHTAGLVIPADKYRNSTVSELSQLYPYSEVPKMRTFQVSEEYNTWDAAFLHTF